MDNKKHGALENIRVLDLTRVVAGPFCGTLLGDMGADVVLENFRPGVMDRLGLGYDDLKKVNDQIIYAATSGFGSYGPYSNRPGYDILGQAMGGLMSLTGTADSGPVRAGSALADMIAGLNTTAGILAAGIPAGPINDVASILADEHIAGAREMLVEVEHPVIGKMTANGDAIKLMDTMPHITRPAPTLGQHNTEVYSEILGLSPQELEQLGADNII